MSFYSGKRVLVTGHTGFKGSWLTEILKSEGAEILGYALDPPTNPSLFGIIRADEGMTSIVGDVRDCEKLKAVFDEFQPQIVFHLAAQPIVRESYKIPAETYAVNVMGTVNVLECARLTPSVKSIVNVTTDKVYLNDGSGGALTEDLPLDGHDPYANSKSCSELVTHSYKRSFFDSMGVAVSTARAGNVIGGGDFASDRIIPDCVRAALSGEKLKIRNPDSVRPYQHVLEPLFAYLMIAEGQYENIRLGGAYNVGPNKDDCLTTGRLAELFSREWGGLKLTVSPDGGPHEDKLLVLDCSKIKSAFGWRPLWNAETAVGKTVEWAKAYRSGAGVRETVRRQIQEYKTKFSEIFLL